MACTLKISKHSFVKATLANHLVNKLEIISNQDIFRIINSDYFEEKYKRIEERTFEFWKLWIIIGVLSVWSRTINLFKPQFPYLWKEDKNTFFKIPVWIELNIYL